MFNEPVITPDRDPPRARPVLKWAGGKAALIPQFLPHLPSPDHYARYIEPFIGGAALFFYLQPENALLFDLNPHLVELYVTVRDHVDDLIVALKKHHNDHDYFYEVRAQQTEALTPIERAARFIFLNRTCYNGLYRVNRQGKFNVPFGKYKNPTLCDEPGLRAASAALRNASIETADFERLIDVAQRGDFIYFDPPYEPLTPTSSFTSYTNDGFTSQDQARLAELYRALDARGCLLMLSNSSAPLIYTLYQDFHIQPIQARRAINSKAEGRGVVTELLVTNYQHL
ncbi:MAG: DNA adenine methylase [Chloroflexota bacterium]|nr:DNA adenine methylase [Chloroflexota bacterium]